MKPIVYLGPLETCSPPFNTLWIYLNGQLNSELKWDQALKMASHCKEKGLSICWHLDLGLFDHLPFPLDYETQYRSLSLAVEHFFSAVWLPFEKESVATCLFQGPLSALENPQMDFLQALVHGVPETIRPLLIVDAEGEKEPFRLLNPSRFTDFLKAVRKSPLPFRDWVWEEKGECLTECSGYIGKKAPSFSLDEEVQEGVCLPLSLSAQEQVNQWVQEKRPFRLLDEASLLLEWDGLDLLWVDKTQIHPAYKRKLLGFQSSGGEVNDILTKAPCF